MYALVKQSLPALRAFTVCLWLRPAEGGIGTPLSYAVPSQPNELVLLQGLHTPTELLVNDKVPPGLFSWNECQHEENHFWKIVFIFF